jgi:hypothetical protein
MTNGSSNRERFSPGTRSGVDVSRPKLVVEFLARNQLENEKEADW